MSFLIDPSPPAALPPVGTEPALADAATPAKQNWRPRSSSLRVRAFSMLVLVDALAIGLSFAAVAALRGGWLNDTSWFLFAAVLLPIYTFVGISMHAFAAAALQDPFRAIRKGEQALLLSIALVALLVFFMKSGAALPRLTVALGSVTAMLSLAVVRYWFATHLAAVVGGNPFSVILILDGEVPKPVGEFSLVMLAHAYFDPDQHDPVMYDRLATSLATADRVVIACPPERRIAWARALRGANIQGEIVVPELAELAPLGLGSSRDMPSVIVAAGPLSLVDRLIKRGFDCVVASFALVLLAPLLLVTAIMVKLDSPGPVMFRQTRIGRGNQMFRMHKFRSMRVDGSDSAGHRSTARDDDRVTRVGRVIRRTSIDELPQLIDVLLGNMSIVGPRPHAIGSRAADKLFWEVDERYWDRHAAKPGLTGLAQVRGFRGATLVEDDLRNRLRADLEYLENWSIWRDMKIIFLTIRVVLHRNAF